MTDLHAAKARLDTSLAELEKRLSQISREENPANPDWGESATKHQQNEALAGQETLIGTEIASIRRALDRIAEGSYGECVRCGRDIAEKRLEARPEAALCIDCARQVG
jgi:RNA polymerase-binding transcription factor DksA